MYLKITMLLFFILPETRRVIIALPEMRLLQLLFKHIHVYILKWNDRCTMLLCVNVFSYNYHIIRYCQYSEIHINVMTHPLYIVARSTYIKIPMHTCMICRNVHLSKKQHYKCLFNLVYWCLTKEQLTSRIFFAWPRVHKAFQNQDQDQAQVKKYFTMELFWNLLYLFNYWLLVINQIYTPNKIAWYSKLCYERKGKF